jgi:PHP family Zn ribbon phosphoesterase
MIGKVCLGGGRGGHFGWIEREEEEEEEEEEGKHNDKK